MHPALDVRREPHPRPPVAKLMAPGAPVPRAPAEVQRIRMRRGSTAAVNLRSDPAGGSLLHALVARGQERTAPGPEGTA